MAYFEAKRAGKGGGSSFNYRDWLTAGGISGSSYANLNAVLQDEVAVRQLMSKRASVDYLANHCDATAELTTILNNDIAAKWITLRDYAENTLSANATIKALMDSSGKYGYGEWALMPQVPTMTANDAPYGEASADSIYRSDYDAWYAFDGNKTTRWNGDNSKPTNYLQYHFINPVKICRVDFDILTDTTGLCLKNYKIQASNDGFVNDTHDIYIGEFENHFGTGSEQHYLATIQFNNDTAYSYWRLSCDSSYNIYSLWELQMYAWQPKGNVPVMTNYNAPYGEASASSNNSGATYRDYHVFDGQYDTEWGSGVSTLPQWVQYKFTNPVAVRRTLIQFKNTSYTAKVTISASNDGFVSDTHDLATNIVATSNNIVITNINNDDYYLYYRLTIVEQTTEPNSSKGQLDTLQFYGRELKVSVPKMTANNVPWGEAIADSNYGADYPYEAFDDDDDWPWDSNQTGSASNIWVGYKFPFPVVVKKAQIAFNKYQGSTSYITSNSYKIQGSNDRFVSDIHDLSGVYTDTNDRVIDLDNDTAYLYYRVLIISQTLSASGWVCGRVVHLQFFGMNYGEYDWDANNPRHYLYDHGVEPNESIILTAGTGAEARKEPDYVYVKMGSSSGTEYRASVTSKLDLTSYDLARSVVKDIIKSDYLAIQVMNISSVEGGVAYRQITEDIPYNGYLDISSVDENDWVGICMTVNGTYPEYASVYELWLE